MKPIFVFNDKTNKIEYANFEFQNYEKKSLNVLKKIELSKLFEKQLIFLSNIREIKNKYGLFVIREAITFDKTKFNAICLIPEKKNKNNFIMVVLEKENHKSETIQHDYGAYDFFFSMLSHEISNPLSSIKMASQLLSKSKTGDQELLEIIQTECARIEKIIKLISKTTEKITLRNKSEENIHEILRYSIFKIQNKKKKIRVIEKFDPSLPKINLEKNSMIQVFDNLIINAYEASSFEDKSYLLIETKFTFGETIKIPNIKKNKKNNFLTVKIEDNGSGINEKEVNKIFLPFYSSKKRGTGIGLYLVKRIINLHSGEVVLERSINKTSFTIKLPL